MITVRSVEPTDATALAALVQEIHAFHAAALPDVFRPASDVVLAPSEAAQLGREPGQVWRVALLDGEVVGYAHAEVQVTPQLRYKRASARLHVHAMGVTAACRGRGVGRALLAAMRAEAAARGLADLSLEVYAFNTAARALYTAEGFVPLREQLVWTAPSAGGPGAVVG